MPLRRQHRQQVAHHEKIEEFEHKQCGQQRERHPIAPVEGRAVEQRQKIVGSLFRHYFLRIGGGFGRRLPLCS
jgi:hypothetical protein